MCLILTFNKDTPHLYVLGELLRRLKPPSSPVSQGLYQGESRGLELDHYSSQVC